MDPTIRGRPRGPSLQSGFSGRSVRALREISGAWAVRPIPVAHGVIEGSGHRRKVDVDIHQDRFALMAVLTRAHVARPAEYLGSESLMAMSDKRLVTHATELLRSLEEAPVHNETTLELRTALREILGKSA
jgi:hypothetical protein